MSLMSKKINCLPVWVRRKKESSQRIANQVQESKSESKRKLKIERDRIINTINL